MAMEMSSSQHEMVQEQRPVMSTDLFLAAMKGDGDVLIPCLGLLEEQKQIKVTIEASHSAPEQIKTEHLTVQSELRSVTRFEETILHILVTKGHNELALMVFRRDVSLLKSPNKNLETPLHCAAKFGNENVIHNLIQIDPAAVKDALEQKNEHGDTALHVAATYDHIGISLALMRLDPEVAYRVNNNMFSVLNVAIDRNYTEMVQTMLEQDHTLAYTQFLTGMFPVHLAASMGNKKLVVHLMEKYPYCAELLDPRGRNLFHYAAEENKYDIFQVTSEDTSTKEILTRMNIAIDCEGNTPLHIAAMKGHILTMKAIYDNKMIYVAETTRNKQGLTPFELSRRQVEEITSKDIDDNDISDYVKQEGDKFTPRWFGMLMYSKFMENKWEKTQVMGLGSVLITTVAFAAAFTIPGGYNQNTGTPILGKRYMFRAFILANAAAFIQGFLSLFALVWRLGGPNLPAIIFAKTTFLFAASSIVVAFGLGMYVTLAPVCYPIAILLLVITLVIGSPTVFLVYVIGQNILGLGQNFKRKVLVLYLVCFMFIFCLGLM